jgi:hypothetical protein
MSSVTTTWPRPVSWTGCDCRRVRRTIGAGRAAGRRDGTVVGRETARVAGPVGSIVVRLAGPVDRAGRGRRGARPGAWVGMSQGVLVTAGRVIVVVLIGGPPGEVGGPCRPGRSARSLDLLT